MRPVSPFRLPVLVAMASAAFVAACGGSTPAASPAPASTSPASVASASPVAVATASAAADDMSALCSLLTPDDFAQHGIDGTHDPEINADEYGAYCTFAQPGAGTSRVELDVFPHEAEADAADTFATAVGQGPPGAAPSGSPFDEASFAIGDETAFLVVRDGNLVIALTATNDVNVDQALLALASLVAERAAAAGQ